MIGFEPQTSTNWATTTVQDKTFLQEGQGVIPLENLYGPLHTVCTQRLVKDSKHDFCSKLPLRHSEY